MQRVTRQWAGGNFLTFQGVNFHSGYDDGYLTMDLCPALLKAQSDKMGTNVKYPAAQITVPHFRR